MTAPPTHGYWRFSLALARIWSSSARSKSDKCLLEAFWILEIRYATPGIRNPIMTSDYFLARKQSGLSEDFEAPPSPTSPQALRSNPLSAKVTSVLSASYADSDIRDALGLLDNRGLENTSETRRQLRLDVQKEVIESNGNIVREFGHVAEVGSTSRDVIQSPDMFT
jgi:hypothetical protein